MSDEAAEILDKKIHELAIHKLPKKGNKSMVQKEILECFIITGQQNLENFNLLNPIDIRMVNNQILNVLQKHKKVTYHFLLIGLLFSGGIKNNTNQTFIVCNDLSDACDSF